jgi:NACHT domain
VATDPPTLPSDSELTRALTALLIPQSRGLLILGGPGSGKTHLLASLYDALTERDCTPVLLRSSELESTGDLAERVIRKLPKTSDLSELELSIVRTSARQSITDAVDTLNRLARTLPAPVLLVDALDESRRPDEVTGIVLDLIRSMTEWKFVVTSRNSEYTSTEPTRLANDLTTFEIRPHPAWESMRRAASQELKDLIDWPPSQLSLRVLQRLALVGPQSESELTEGLRCSARELADATDGPTGHFLTSTKAGTIYFAHHAFLELVRERNWRETRIQISSLRFGLEEGEVDPILNHVYVDRPGTNGIGSEFSIVVGNRGSGKSAIRRRLLEGRVKLRIDDTTIASLEDPGSALSSLVAKDGWADHEQLRTAWTLLIASEVAARVHGERGSSFEKQRQSVLAAVGKHVSNGGWMRQWLGRVFGGTKIRFTVGPVDLVAELPHPVLGINPQPVNLTGFMSEANSILAREGRVILCLVDGIDEVSKYDRVRQEVAIQALFQAEHFLLQFSSIRPVIFLRTDLFA